MQCFLACSVALTILYVDFILFFMFLLSSSELSSLSPEGLSAKAVELERRALLLNYQEGLIVLAFLSAIAGSIHNF